MVLAGPTDRDGEFGSPEPRVIQFDPAGEKGGFIRVLRVSRHQAEVGAALARRLIDHLSLVVDDNAISGQDMQTAVRCAESRHIVSRPLHENELLGLVADQHLAGVLCVESHGTPSGRLCVSNGRRGAQLRLGSSSIGVRTWHAMWAEVETGSGIDDDHIHDRSIRGQERGALTSRQVEHQSVEVRLP